MNKKVYAILTSLVVMALALTSCGSPTPMPEPLEYSTFAALQADCKNVLEQERPVMLTGILHMSSKVTCDSYHCALTLRHADPADTGFAWATIWVMDSWAPDSNEMASLKDEYEESDIKLYTEDGRILGVGDRVTVIGWPENFPCLTIEVEIIR